MNPQKEKEIVAILESNKQQGVSFFQTKEQLLKAGYSEADIVYALYSEPFDVNKNDPKPPHLLDKLYAENPEKAQAIAHDLLQSQKQEDFDETLADYAAGAFAPDVQSRSYYDVLSADRLGIPYFTLMLGGIVLMGIAIKFNWPQTLDRLIQVGYGILISLIFVYKLIQEKRQIKK